MCRKLLDVDETMLNDVSKHEPKTKATMKCQNYNNESLSAVGKSELWVGSEIVGILESV